MLAERFEEHSGKDQHFLEDFCATLTDILLQSLVIEALLSIKSS